MVERNEYPPGVPCWVDTLQPDPQAAMRFYGELMTWTFEGPGPGDYFVARLRGRDVAGVGRQPMSGVPSMWNTYVAVESAEETAKKVKDAGGKILREPFDVLPAGRVAVFADPAGAPACAWEARDRKGAQLVSEIGAWAMSTLSTPDPDAAKKFYSAVFGWTAEPLKMNGTEMTLWRRPGYVGGTAEQPVPRDVVGLMMPKKPGGPGADGPPNWIVSFWIADADAAADQTKKLGGRVLVPPFDIPRFRQTILADPAGAVFTVSQPKLEK
jgi:predicted enzyme related to lactoylglutathione lyase